MSANWRSREVIAWTEKDGPGRPPAASRRWVSLGLAGGLGVVFAGMWMSDTVCAEHRAWVVGLASAAIFSTLVSIVGLVREWAGAPFIAIATAGAGVAIGLIDAVHAPTRGRLIALSFGLAVLVAAWLAAKSIGALRWHSNTLAATEAPAYFSGESHPQEQPSDLQEASENRPDYLTTR